MGKIAKMIEGLKTLTPERLEEEALKALRDNEEEIINLNQGQLMEGLTSKGQHIKPPYKSDSYANFKLRRNPLGVVDLNLTGAFYNGFFVAANSFPALLGSADEKTFSLIQKYGKDIFGLDKGNTQEVNHSIVLPRIKELIRKTIHVQ